MKFGATGKYPHGSFGPHDEGALQMGVARDSKGNVHVNFGTSHGLLYRLNRRLTLQNCFCGMPERKKWRSRFDRHSQLPDLWWNPLRQQQVSFPRNQGRNDGT